MTQTFNISATLLELAWYDTKDWYWVSIRQASADCQLLLGRFRLRLQSLRMDVPVPMCLVKFQMLWNMIYQQRCIWAFSLTSIRIC